MKKILNLAISLCIITTVCGSSFCFAQEPFLSIKHGEWPYPDTSLTEFLIFDISNDSKRMVTCQYDVKLWDIETKTVIAEFPQEDPRESGAIRCVKFSPDNKYIFTGRSVYYGTLWDLETGTALHRIKTAFIDSGESTSKPIGLTGATFRANKSTFLSADFQGYIQEWDIKTGEEVSRFRNQSISEIRQISMLPDGNHLLVHMYDGLCVVIDWKTQQTVQIKGMPAAQKGSPFFNAYIYALSDDENSLAILSNEKTLFVVDTEKIEVVSKVDLSLHDRPIGEIAISNNKNWLLFGASLLGDSIGNREIVNFSTQNVVAQYPYDSASDKNESNSIDSEIKFLNNQDVFVTRNQATIHFWDISNLTSSVSDAKSLE